MDVEQIRQHLKSISDDELPKMTRFAEDLLQACYLEDQRRIYTEQNKDYKGKLPPDLFNEFYKS